MDSDNQQGPSMTPGTAVTTPQIRSRITVVCAECKRLKLKCDRRNPCGSCTKRDTVARCIYSPAAAEKVDLHSLNNRLIQVEATLAQLTSGQFMPSYPFSAPTSSSTGPPPPSLSLNVTLSPPTIQHSSLAIPLDEIGGTWLNEIDLGFSLPKGFGQDDRSTANIKLEPRSVEMGSADPDDFDMTDRPSSSSSTNHSASSTASSSPDFASLSISPSCGHSLLPASTVYYDLSTSAKPYLTPALIALLPSLNSTSSSSRPQQLTLLSFLTLAEKSTAYTYPFLNWKTLRERALELVANARSKPFSPAASAQDKELVREKEREKEREKKEKEAARARQLFVGSTPLRGPPVFGAAANGDVNMEDMSSKSRSHYRAELAEEQSGRPTSPRQVADIPFFAALCAAIALGALEGNKGTRLDTSKKGTEKSRSRSNFAVDSAYWYSLSVQAVGVWEAGVAVTPVANDAPTSSNVVELHDNDNETRRSKEEQQHEMDYITACLLQLTFLAKDGLSGGDVAEKDDSAPSPGLAKEMTKGKSAKGVAAVMFPLVGKVVNYARQMSLNKDPEDMGPAIYMQTPDSGYSNSPLTASSSCSSGNGSLPSGAKKAKSNSKLSDPSASVVPCSRAARESRFNLYDAEIRRRVWWTIMYYDLFVSDIMNQPPLVADNSFSTKLPVANVDEKVFGPMSNRIPPPPGGGEDGSGYSKDGMRYFEIRSRMTLLVRSIKRRMNTPEFGHAQQVRMSYYGSSPNSHCYSIDQAASMEAEVRSWLNDLPAYYQLDHDGSEDAEPTLIAQRCEVAMTAHRLVLRVYLPFLRKHAAGVPHQASLGSINAAHGIMKAAKTLSELWKSQEGLSVTSSHSPALFDFYPFPRSVFDAAVVCAHAVIKQPSTMWAAAAMEDVETALEVMKSVPASKFGSAVGATHVISSADCIRIVEALKQKAESGDGSRRGGRSSSPNVPSKRKYHEVDELEHSPPPTPAYVYPVIPSATISPPPEPTSTPVVSQPPPPPPIVQPPKRSLPFPVVTSDAAKHEPHASGSPKGNDKDKKQKKPYPVVGVRKRPTKDSSPLVPSPVAKPPSTNSNASSPAPSRRDSVGAAGTSPVTEKTTSAPVKTIFPNSHQPSPAAAHPPPFQSPTIASAAQEQFNYRSRSSSLSQDPRLHAQRQRRDSTLSTSTDYPMANYHQSEEQHIDLTATTPSPQNVHAPEMHMRPPTQPHPHQNLYAESPSSYETSSGQSLYDFPFNTQQSTVETYNATRNNAFDVHSDNFSSSSSSPYGNSGSPYSSTSTGTPTFGTHQPSPPSFSRKSSIHNHQDYYGSPVISYEAYDGGADVRQLHADNIQAAMSDVVDEPMIFDPVSYDVKPSMDKLNEQHQQQTYQAYNPHSHSDTHPHSQLSHAVPQVWTTLSNQQQGHIPDSGSQYWGDPSIQPDHQAYYQAQS